MSLDRTFEHKLREIFLRSMKGDAVAYEQFLSLTQGFVSSYLARLGGRALPSEERADLCQEVLVSIHLKRHTYRPEAAILPWLYAITRYRYIDFYRARQRAPRFAELSDEIAHPDASTSAVSVEELRQWLTPTQWQALELVKLEGMSGQEAAQSLNLSVSALKVTVHRALKTLRERVRL